MMFIQIGLNEILLLIIVGGLVLIPIVIILWRKALRRSK